LDLKSRVEGVTTFRRKSFLVQRFCVTRILQGGREYFVANYPANRKPWSRKAAGRAQRKFNRRELAEAFLEEAKREWKRKGGVNLGLDREAHHDFMRAMEVIAGLPGGTLEKGALMLKMCASAKEKPGGAYEAPVDRKVELSPRFFLLADNEARKHGMSVREAVEGMLAGWLEFEAERQVKERTKGEAREYQELMERNQKTRRMLAQIEEEDRLMELMGKQSQAFELGRNSVLMQRNRYQQEWRRKRKERLSNGNSGLQ
jgi:hypothetical protein